MRGKNILWLSLVVMLLGVMMVNVGKAPGLPKLWVDPAGLPSHGVGHPGDTYYVSINIDNVEDLYAVGVTVQFARYVSVLVASDVAEGDFLKQDGNSTAFVYRISGFQGTIKIGISRMGSVPGISGSGTLATFKFSVREAGNSPIELTKIALIDSTGSVMEPFETVGGNYYGVTAKMSSTTLHAGTLHPSFMEGEEVGVTPTPVVGETVGVETWTYIDHEWVGTGDKVTTTFSLAQAPMVPESETIWLWKTAQVRDVDYTIDYDTNMVTFMTAPPKKKEIYADYTIWQPMFQVANTPVIEGTETIWVDSVEQVKDTNYAIDYATGIIEFLNMLSDGATITANYIPGSLTYGLGYPPVVGTETIYVAGVLQERGADYSPDYVSATITFLSIPVYSEVITADYEYTPVTRETTGKVKNEADLPLEIRVRYDNIRVEDGKKTTVYAGQMVTNGPARETEYLYVDGFTPGYAEWNTAGTAPYLDAPGDGNMIEGTFDAAWMNWFTFEDIALGGAVVKNVVLEGLCKGPYNEDIDYDIYDGSFNWYGSLYGMGDWAWVEPRWTDGMSVSDQYPQYLTEEGINNAMVLCYFFDPTGAGGAGNFIDCLRLRIEFTSKDPLIPPIYTIQPGELLTVGDAVWILIGPDKGTYICYATVEYTYHGLFWHEGEKVVTYSFHFGP